MGRRERKEEEQGKRGADAAQGSKGVMMVYSEDSSTTAVSEHHQEEFEWYVPSRERPGELKETRKRSGLERRSSSSTSPDSSPRNEGKYRSPEQVFKRAKGLLALRLHGGEYEERGKYQREASSEVQAGTDYKKTVLESAQSCPEFRQ